MRVSQLIELLQEVNGYKEVYVYNDLDSSIYDVLEVDELSDRVDINLGGKL